MRPVLSPRLIVQACLTIVAGMAPLLPVRAAGQSSVFQPGGRDIVNLDFKSTPGGVFPGVSGCSRGISKW